MKILFLLAVLISSVRVFAASSAPSATALKKRDHIECSGKILKGHAISINLVYAPQGVQQDPPVSMDLQLGDYYDEPETLSPVTQKNLTLPASAGSWAYNEFTATSQGTTVTLRILLEHSFSSTVNAKADITTAKGTEAKNLPLWCSIY